VEADAADRTLIQDLLGGVDGAKYVVDVAGDYDDGLRRTLRQQHDVYLIGYGLGQHTGVDLLRAAGRAGIRGPMILVTDPGDRRFDTEAMPAGATDHLFKGEITPQLLDRSIRYAIDRRRAADELAETRRRLFETPEQERTRLARELHDGPLQDLIGASFQLAVIAEELRSSDATEPLAAVQASVQTVIQTIRAICGELRPPSLAPFGLDRAIRSHARRLERQPPIRLELDEDGVRLSQPVRLALFRIYQTAIANVMEHAAAAHVVVRLRFDGSAVRFEVEDDGGGFDVPRRWREPARGGRMGLLGASERAASVGGTLDVRSAPGEGTHLVVEVPLGPSPEHDGRDERALNA
jgi:signal transduction histidine kinase